MLTKIISNSIINGIFNISSLKFNSTFNFCNNSRSNRLDHPLKSKIIEISTLQQFGSFFKQHSNEFDNFCFSVAARSLSKILIDNTRFNYAFQQRSIIKGFLDQLLKLNIQSLSISEFSQLLFLLRTIKLDPYNNNNWVLYYSRNVLQQADSKYLQIEKQCAIGRLAYFYQQFSGLQSKFSSSTAKRINQMIKTANPQSDNEVLKISQILLIMKGLKSKHQLSLDQLLLLKNVTSLVNTKYLKNISFLQLVQLSCNLNEILYKHPNNIINHKQCDQLFKKCLQNIQQMDQKSIMFLLNSKNTGNKIFHKINKIIFDKIFDQLSPIGQSSFNQLFTYKLFNGICNKIKLRDTTEQNQNKFFAFLSQSLKKTPRYANNFIQTFVQKNFFTQLHLKKVVEILQTLPKEQNIKLSFLTLLVDKKMNVQNITSFDTQKSTQFKQRNLIYYSAIIQGLSQTSKTNADKYKQLLVKVKARFAGLYKIQDGSFAKLLNNLEPEMYNILSKVYKDQIQNFPNPFETQQTDYYRNNYLKLCVLGSGDYTFLKKDLFIIKKGIKEQDVIALLRYLQNMKSTKGYYTNIFSFLRECISVSLPNKIILSTLNKFIHNNLVDIIQDSNELTRQKLWSILYELHDKMDISEFLSTFNSTILLILSSNNYNLSLSEQYKSFIKRILTNIQKCNRNIVKYIVSECLKLNLIRREDIQLFTPRTKSLLTNYNQLLLNMIEKNQFILQNHELNKDKLSLYLFNNSPQTINILKQNKQKVISIIKQMKVRDLWKCITSYRLGYQTQIGYIIDNLFENFNNNAYITHEQFSPILAFEAYKRNYGQRNMKRSQSFRNYFKKTLEYFGQKNKVYKLNIEQHVMMVKYGYQLRLINEQYIHNILDRYSEDVSHTCRQLYLLCGQIGFQFTSAQINKLISKKYFIGINSSFSKCFNIFLLTQEKLSNPEVVLQIIINRYKFMSQKQKIPIHSLYFEYLKKTYPTQTQNFTPNIISQIDFCKNIDSLMKPQINLFRQVTQQVFGEKWFENIIHSNYYYTLKNYNFVFPQNPKLFGENKMLLKLLKKLTGKQNFIFINKIQKLNSKLIDYIKQNSQNLITPEIQEKLLNKTKELFDKNKAQQQDNVVQEQSQNKKE